MDPTELQKLWKYIFKMPIFKKDNYADMNYYIMTQFYEKNHRVMRKVMRVYLFLSMTIK